MCACFITIDYFFLTQNTCLLSELKWDKWWYVFRGSWRGGGGERERERERERESESEREREREERREKRRDKQKRAGGRRIKVQTMHPLSFAAIW